MTGRGPRRVDSPPQPLREPRSADEANRKPDHNSAGTLSWPRPSRWRLPATIAAIASTALGGSLFSGSLSALRSTSQESSSQPQTSDAGLEHGSGAALIASALRASGFFNANRAVSPSDLQGRPVIIDYWGSHCPPCIASIPELNKLQAEHAKDGLVVISLVNEPAQDVLKFANGTARNQISYLIGVEAAEAFAAPSPAITAIPRTIVIDRNGNIIFDEPGATKDSIAHAAIDAINSKAAVEKKGSPDFLCPGKAIGSAAKISYEDTHRPESVKAFSLERFEGLVSKLNATDAPSEEQFSALKLFVTRNLPQDTWTGNKEIRERAGDYLANITARGPTEFRASAEGFFFDWLQQKEPSPEVRSSAYTALVVAHRRSPLELRQHLVPLLEQSLNSEPDARVKAQLQIAAQAFRLEQVKLSADGPSSDFLELMRANSQALQRDPTWREAAESLQRVPNSKEAWDRLFKLVAMHSADTREGLEDRAKLLGVVDQTLSRPGLEKDTRKALESALAQFFVKNRGRDPFLDNSTLLLLERNGSAAELPRELREQFKLALSEASKTAMLRLPALTLSYMADGAPSFRTLQ